MKKHFIKYLLLILCWFLVLEILSRWAVTIKPFYDKYIKNVSDAGMRLEGAREFSDPYHGGSYRYYLVYHPTRGWAVKPNVTNQIVFQNKILNTNSRGIRGKIEYGYEKDPNRVRILILGDSFTFGDEVSDTETYPYYLQRLLPNAEIINFGVSVYGQDQMLIYLMEEGLKYHPDIILLGSGPWDDTRNLSEFYYSPKPRFRWVWGKLILCNSPAPTQQSVFKNEFWRSRFVDLVEVLVFDILNKIGMIDHEAESMTNHILDKIVATARENKVRIIFVPLAHSLLFEKDPSLQEVFPNQERFIHAWESKGVACVSIKPFPISGFQNDIFPTWHYKPIVYERIAQGIKDYLLNNHLVKQ